MKKEIEIIALIYKSIDYLNFIENQLLGDFCKVTGWDVNVRVVANNATESVLTALKTKNIPYSIYNDPHPKDFYLNRVYRCWNYAGKTSNYSNICFVNSDMAFSKNWLDNLLKYHDGINIPCARLVESNKMPSGTYGISQNFGRTPNTIKLDKWYEYADSIKENITRPGGLYMPCVFETSRFKESNMYPPGNVFRSDDRGLEVGHPNDRPVYKSGDDYYFNNVLTNRFNMKHITVFDSLVYHIQEGEKDE
tara:strand:+ start:3853 stop:4602 length:750 start_codon:yes stop_codon:yes gene_type:complete